MTTTIHETTIELSARFAGVRDELRSLLVQVEDSATADRELAWVGSALAQWGDASAQIAGRAPIGSVAVLTPSTLPVYSALLFAGGAALPGNRVTLRPSGRAGTAAGAFVEQVLVPSGLEIELTQQSGRELVRAAATGDALVFTGSPENADAIAAGLPEDVVMAYQGPGVCAAVVGPTADVAQAVDTVVADRLFNVGQDCMSIERLYVHTSRADEVLAGLRARAGRLRVSERLAGAGDLFPLQAPEAYRGRLLTGMAEATEVHVPGDERADGVFGLAVMTCEADSATVLREAYGPLLPVVIYSDDGELKEMLELGDFALGLEVFGDLPKFGVLDFAHVTVNRSLYDEESFLMPFGGYRRTSFVRGEGRRTAGPHWLPWIVSAPGSGRDRL